MSKEVLPTPSGGKLTVLDVLREWGFDAPIIVIHNDGEKQWAGTVGEMTASILRLYPHVLSLLIERPRMDRWKLNGISGHMWVYRNLVTDSFDITEETKVE